MFRACVVLLVLLSAGCDRPGGGGAEASRPEPVASAAPSGSAAEAEVPGAGKTATTPASTPSSAPAPVEPDPQVTLGPVHRLTVRDLDGNPEGPPDDDIQGRGQLNPRWTPVEHESSSSEQRLLLPRCARRARTSTRT
ncbi:MAG: hypothetical protein ACO31E_07730, partial [Phycisphaerales bacterium]